jgi:hypothetical protein
MSEHGTLAAPAAAQAPAAHPPAPAPRAARGGLRYNALWNLTRARVLSFMREPEVAFWVFAFPVLMALALGIAFRSSGTPTSRIGVENGPGAAAVAEALSKSPDLVVLRLSHAEAEAALRRGKIALLVRPVDGGPPALLSDATRPESRSSPQAHTDTSAAPTSTASETGSRASRAARRARAVMGAIL